MGKSADRIKELEETIYEHGIFTKTYGGMLHEDIEEEVMWLINHTKEQAKTIERLREAYDLKTIVHDRVNRDYVELRAIVHDRVIRDYAEQRDKVRGRSEK